MPNNRTIHSMAAHELEMQRQIMSVPPMNLPPPGSNAPPAAPTTTNVPPLGMPPSGMLPPGIPPPGMPPPGMPPAGMPPPNMAPPNMPPPNWHQDESHNIQNTENGIGSLELPSLMSMKLDKPDDMKNKSPSEVILPKALEDVFAFKDQLAGELGRADGEVPVDIVEKPTKTSAGVISTEYADADADSDDDDFIQQLTGGSVSVVSKQQSKLDKNKKKKKRKKANRQKRQANQKEAEEKRPSGDASATVEKSNKESLDQSELDDVTVEYIPDKITVADLAPMYRQFYRVFEIFKLEDKPSLDKNAAALAEEKAALAKKEKDKQIEDDDEDLEDERKDDKEKLSKRKLKKLTRLSVAELKQLVHRPDVVEMHDVTARDPKLLVQLKAHRNTVQVPRHWCFKRKYLQGKRGIEKPPFDLPAFIKKTGIMEMRASLQEKDEAKTLKAKMRERARPKMGKIDIDYQKLHDAFFK